MRLTWIAPVLLALTVACSGSAGETTTSSSTSAPAATSAATTAAASKAGTTAATAAATTAPPKATGGTSSGTNDACTLISTDDVAKVMSASGVKAESLTGDPAYCTYRDAVGAALAATTLMRKDATTGYQLWAGSAKPVSGLGERAQWEPSTATLMIMKGGSVLAITAGDSRMDDAKRQDLAKQLGAIGVTKQ